MPVSSVNDEEPGQIAGGAWVTVGFEALGYEESIRVLRQSTNLLDRTEKATPS